MVVNPVKFEEEDSKSNGTNKTDGLNSIASISASAEQKNEDKKVQQKQQVQWSNQNAAIANWFSPDGSEFIAKHKQKIKSEKELGQKDIPTISILGEDFDKDNLPAFTEQIAAGFYQLCMSRNSMEAATEFIKNTPTSIQSDVLKKIIEQVDAEGTWSQDSVKEFFLEVAKSNILQPKEKDAVFQKLNGHDQPKILLNIQNSLTKLNNLVSKVSQTSTALFGADNLDDLEKTIDQLGDPKLLGEFQKLKQLFLETNKLLKRTENDFKDGLITLKHLEETLNDVVLVMDVMVDSFLQTSADYRTAHQGENRVEEFGFSLQAVELKRDNQNKSVADLVRKIYQDSQGKTVVKLDPEAYARVNQSLENLGLVKLTSIFCDKELIGIDSLKDLDFLKNSYELSNKQTFNNLNIVVRYIYSVFHKDIKEREKSKEELLAQLREIEKFLDECHQKAVEFNKRLEHAAQKERLAIFDITISTYKNMISDLEKGNGLKFITGEEKGSGVIAWYQELLDQEKKRQVAQVILEMTSPTVSV